MRMSRVHILRLFQLSRFLDLLHFSSVKVLQCWANQSCSNSRVGDKMGLGVSKLLDPVFLVLDETAQEWYHSLTLHSRCAGRPHQFLYNKKNTSLCYGLGMDMVHQDFSFQSIREKKFKREIKGMENS